MSGLAMEPCHLSGQVREPCLVSGLDSGREREPDLLSGRDMEPGLVSGRDMVSGRCPETRETLVSDGLVSDLVSGHGVMPGLDVSRQDVVPGKGVLSGHELSEMSGPDHCLESVQEEGGFEPSKSPCKTGLNNDPCKIGLLGRNELIENQRASLIFKDMIKRLLKQPWSLEMQKSLELDRS